MPDTPQKPHAAPRVAETTPPAVAEGEENERPTVSPPFDPVAYARDAYKPSPAPMQAVNPGRPTPPGGTGQGTPPRRKTPTRPISLANALAPSDVPPRPARKAEAVAEPATKLPPAPLVDEFGDFDLPTRPPPADSPHEDPFLEVSRTSRADVEDDLEFDLAAEAAREAAVEPVRPSESNRVEPALSPTAAMNARIELGDYTGALEIAEEILSTDPSNLSARACAETCRSVLRQMYTARIGPLEGVPIVMVPRDQLRWLSIDHKAGFVLSLVDGVSSLEMIIDVSGMPELDTLRILSELAQQRIISLRT